MPSQLHAFIPHWSVNGYRQIRHSINNLFLDGINRNHQDMSGDYVPETPTYTGICSIESTPPSPTYEGMVVTAFVPNDTSSSYEPITPTYDSSFFFNNGTRGISSESYVPKTPTYENTEPTPTVRNNIQECDQDLTSQKIRKAPFQDKANCQCYSTRKTLPRHQDYQVNGTVREPRIIAGRRENVYNEKKSFGNDKRVRRVRNHRKLLKKNLHSDRRPKNLVELLSKADDCLRQQNNRYEKEFGKKTKKEPKSMSRGRSSHKSVRTSPRFTSRSPCWWWRDAFGTNHLSRIDLFYNHGL